MHVALSGEARQLHRHIASIENPLPSPNWRYLAFAQVSADSDAWIIDNIP